MDEIIELYPTNQNTLYLLHLFYSDNEIVTVRNLHYHLLGQKVLICLVAKRLYQDV